MTKLHEFSRDAKCPVIDVKGTKEARTYQSLTSETLRLEYWFNTKAERKFAKRIPPFGKGSEHSRENIEYIRFKCQRL